MYPVHLELSPEQSEFQATCRRFLANESPLSEVRALIDDPAGFDRRLWRREAELGWFGLLVPEQFGGSLSGHSLTDLTLVAGEIGSHAHPGPVLTTNIVTSAIADCGSDFQKAEFLPRLVAGEAIATWCVGEPSWLRAGRSSGVKATAELNGYVLQGTETFIPYAQVADYFLVTAEVDGGVTQFLVSSESADIRIEPQECLDVLCRLARIQFTGVWVPPESVIGQVGAASFNVTRQFELALVLQISETVGAVQRVFEFTLEYAKDRVAFGRPIGSYQAIKHRLADMLLWLETCKATAAAAVAALQARDEEASHLVSVAKAYIGQWAPTIIQECVQIHGGIGMTWDHDIHLYLRKVATNAALYGTPADHRDHLCDLLRN